MKEKLLDLKVFWLPLTKEVFFKGKVKSISSENPVGKFDVLPLHANFITLIFNELEIVTEKGEKINYQFKKGVLEVKKNKVNVFLGF
jgi:F0F1-type ATP synthase epsilon subunit